MSLPASNNLYFGGDYNPEQWDPSVWEEDVRLMRQAGVNLVTLGVFAWANLEYSADDYHFQWLDEIFELLHQNGIGIDLATATASPPAWLVKKFPEVLPVTDSGVRLSHGGRQAYCPSSPIYKDRAVKLAQQLAKRYSNHSALVMWHVNNEYGCHNPHCFCEVSAKSFITWLKKKYKKLDELNNAWGTNFWSQRYHDWSEISPPRKTPMGTYPNPSQTLDFYRFSNDEILELFKAERDAIKQIDSIHPVTTNFMSMKHSKYINYWQWAKEVDFVSTDHYLNAEDEDSHIDLAFQADLTRGFAAGRNWLLMEHSTSAVNWQDANLPKASGEMARNSLSHIARGSEGAMFFQWRASVSGSEKFHSAMVPHAGADSRTFRDVCELGSTLQSLKSLTGNETQPAIVAMIFDYECYWALSQRNLPSTDIFYPEIAQNWYRALWQLGVRVDFLGPDATSEKLAKYDLVLVPMLYLISDALEEKLLGYQGNGSLVVSYFSGISNPQDKVKIGGYGGRLVSDGLGTLVEEFAPRRAREVFQLSNGYKASSWSEFASNKNAEVVASYTDGPAEGGVAISKTVSFSEPSWYIGTNLTDESTIDFFEGVIGELGIQRYGGSGVEVITRGNHTLIINHTNSKVTLKYAGDEVAVEAGSFFVRGAN